MLPPKEQMEQLKREQQGRFQDEGMPQPAFPGFGPPDFGDESEQGFAREEDLEDYPTWHSEQTEPEDEDYLTVDAGEEAPYGFTEPPSYAPTGDYPTPPSMRQKGNSFLREEAIFEGGPSQSEVSSWKKQFEVDNHTVNLSEHAGEVFIWRTLNRVEYREIMALPNTDPLQREEIICEICVLFPYEYNFTNMAANKAGIPAVLAQQIMKESGFDQPSPPVRL